MKRTDSSSKNVTKGKPPVARETDADRARAIVASLRAREPSSEEVFEAFWQLDALPVNDVREAFTSWLGPLPDLDRLDPATRLAHGFPPPPLRLRTLSVAHDADVLDLGPVAEAQLRVAGTTWDGADLAPEDRLDGELEGSWAGTLERRVLADVTSNDGAPLFDVLLFAEDSGVVFASGTTKVVALIAYRKVETRDRRLRSALEDALSAPAIVAPRESAVAPSVTVVAEDVVTRKAISGKKSASTGPKKSTAKKSASKTGPKKSTAKKSASKTGPKSTAKKSARTKAGAKNAGAKKASASKRSAVKNAGAATPSKKIAAKKIAAKKRPSKKSASPKKRR